LSLDNDLFCWGKGDLGSIGNGSFEDQVIPQKSLEHVVDFSIRRHVCALTEKGEVFCWGYNDSGEVGDGSQENQATPKKVPVGTSKKVRAANSSSCALSESEDVFCWGLNYSIFLGATSSVEFFLKPFKIKTNAKFEDIVVGSTFFGYDKENKNVLHVWGENGHGEAALGSTQNPFYEPQILTLEKNVKNVQTFSNNTCFLFEDGTLACSGENGSCQMMSDDLSDRLSPAVLDTLPPLADFSLVGSSTCGLTMEGEVYCWGKNLAQIANSDQDFFCKPQKIEGLPKVAQLANGGQSSCILSVDNEVYCWGFYWDGTLTGDKTPAYISPRKVPWLASVLRPNELRQPPLQFLQQLP